MDCEGAPLSRLLSAAMKAQHSPTATTATPARALQCSAGRVHQTSYSLGEESGLLQPRDSGLLQLGKSWASTV